MRGWIEYKIEELCKVGRGSSPRPIDNPVYFEGGTIPWVKIADATASGKKIYSTKEYINEFGARYSRKLPVGSLILATSGVSLGQTKILGVEACIHDGWLYFDDFNDKLDKEYFYHRLLLLTDYLHGQSYGAAIQNVNTGILRAIKLKLPSLPTQRRIASILSAYDDLIENNLKRIKLLEESLQIIQNKLSTETDSNPSLIYPEIADFEKGFEPGSNSYVEEYSNGLIPFIRVGDLNSRESKLYINSELKGIKMSQSDDILISMDGSIGIVSVGINGAYSSGIRKVALKNRLLKGLIYAFLKSPTGQSQIMTFAKGSTILHASSCIPKLKVLIPNEIKYKNEFELANSCLDQIIKLISQNKILKESRDILLPRLMSGKINVE